MNKKSIKIDFWGIGAQKSGTTWLFYNLNQLPEFSLPPEKEFHYFDRSTEYHSPNKLSESLLIKRVFSLSFLKGAYKFITYSLKTKDKRILKFYLKWFFSNYNDKWYLSLFKDYNKIKGEITPSYSILNEVDIIRMYKMSPDAKLVLMLRNPIERAWSHYRHFVTNENKKLSEDDILKFINHDKQLLRSDYKEILKKYSTIFPKEQVLIGFYDAIIDSPKQLMNEIVYFLTENKHISIEHLDLKKIINKSMELECPKKIHDYLKIKYYDSIKELSDEYGGYFTKWLEEIYGDSSLVKDVEVFPTIKLDKQ